MRQKPCDSCKRDTPLSQTFGIRDRSLCQACADAMCKDPAQKVIQAEVTRSNDPTVCVFCSADNGSTEWPALAGLGVCPPCTDRMRHRPFPAWLHAAMVTLLALAGLSLVRGGQYYDTEVALIHAERHMEAKEWSEAAAEYRKVRAVAPDNRDFMLRQIRADILAENWQQAEPALKRIEHQRFEGREIDELNRLLDRVSRARDEMDEANKAIQQEEFAAALTHFKKAEQSYPESRTIRMGRLMTEAVVAFDAKDYDGFLRASRAALALEPEDPRLHGTVASALAAQYAVSGDPRLEREARAELEEARRLTTTSEQADDFEEYEPRILHRLRTREVIDRAEYNRRYRQGVTRQ